MSEEQEAEIAARLQVRRGAGARRAADGQEAAEQAGAARRRRAE